MNGRLSAQTESTKTSRPPETSVDKYPERFGSVVSTVERLARLATEHQRAALERAMRLAGARGLDRPSLDALRTAENPPAPVYALVGPRTPPRPTEDQVAERAQALTHSPAWLAEQPRSTSRHDRLAAATRDARIALIGEWARAPHPERVMVNQAAREEGQRLAVRWRPVLDELEAILDALEARVPDVWLASISEEGLRAAAAAAAQLGMMTTPAHEMDTPEARRARCPMHHRRALRRRAATARQHVAALLGTVGQGAAPYADAYAVACWRERQAAAKAFGLTHLATFEDGRQIPLWDLMETSRKSRLAALYAQMLGLDDLAERRGLVPLFLTMTLPPDHHPNPRHGRPYGGLDWDEAPSPSDTDAALQGAWARFRARLAADGISPLGPRVIEPYQDGCPHLHGLLFVKDETEATTLDRHLMAVCPEPVEVHRIASKMERIDRRRAKPSTYIMKYITATLPAPEKAAELADGIVRDGDPDKLAHFAEVAAWGSERRLRRFAWCGLHGLRTV